MNAERGSEFLRFPGARFSTFHDPIVLRDPRGASGRPGLVVDDQGTLHAFARFLVVHEYRILKDDAIRFLQVTRDENPIHVQQDIAPGAMTLSKSLLPIEVLMDPFSVTYVKAKFTGASFYGERTVNHFFVSPGEAPDTLRIDVNTYQGGRIIAKTEVKGAFAIPEREGTPELLDAPLENVQCLRDFCESLGIAPSHYIEGLRLKCQAFPRAFLASLPSGEMVRQLKGKGGILNVLALDFTPCSYPVTAKSLPEIHLEKGRKGPKMFSRVMTKIMDGIRTYGKGFALVNRHATSP
jgi:acyl dehydratase